MGSLDSLKVESVTSYFGSLKVDEADMMKSAKIPKSSHELKVMKAELDELSALLKAGSATKEVKASMQALTSALKSSLKTRSVAEAAAKGSVSTEELLRDQEELAGLVSKLKSGTLDAAGKSYLGSLKDKVKDSLEVHEMRTTLANRTKAKKQVSILLDKNLEEARKGRNITVCFLLDCTGSMDPYIRGIQAQICGVADRYKKLYGDSVLRFGFVGYRDFDTPQFDILDFTTDLRTFTSFVGGVNADGGGDACEDVVGGLREATKLSWDASSGSSCILVHIADAPAHGEKYNGGCGDDYPTASKDGSTLDATGFLTFFKGSKIHYFFYRVNDTCDEMIRQFNKDVRPRKLVDELDAMAYVKIQELSDVDNLADTVLKTFSSSVMITQSIKKSEHYKKFASVLTTVEESDAASDSGATDIPEPTKYEATKHSSINWDGLPSIQVKLWKVKDPLSLASLQAKTAMILCQMMCDGPDGTTEKKWYDTPFAKGASRSAFWAQLKTREGWQNFVVKRFMNSADHTKFRYLKSAEESTIASFLAKNFNASRLPHGCKPVRILDAFVVEHAGYFTSEYFAVEEVLPPGKFEKYCNNVGTWDEGLLDRSLLEFAKYTYDATNGYMIVCDLQGVDTGSEFVLTDPALCCCDVDRFTETNFGERGNKINIEMVKKYLGAIR